MLAVFAWLLETRFQRLWLLLLLLLLLWLLATRAWRSCSSSFSTNIYTHSHSCRSFLPDSHKFA